MSGSLEVILIAAVARNGVIGRENALPWRLKADLAHFKARTMGHPVLMGRKTWESLGRPLPGRRNLVLTRDAGYCAEGAEVFTSLDCALGATTGKLFVIGGAEIYRAALHRADVLDLTEVDAEVDGDAFFPEFDRSAFREVSREHRAADAENEFGFDFAEYRRAG